MIAGPERTPLHDRVNAALDLVRPGLQADGGDAWLVKIEAGVAYLQLIGACGGCAMSQSTLKQYVEATVRAHVPEITAVEQV